MLGDIGSFIKSSKARSARFVDCFELASIAAAASCRPNTKKPGFDPGFSLRISVTSTAILPREAF